MQRRYTEVEVGTSHQSLNVHSSIQVYLGYLVHKSQSGDEMCCCNMPLAQVPCSLCTFDEYPVALKSQFSIPHLLPPLSKLSKPRLLISVVLHDPPQPPPHILIHQERHTRAWHHAQ